MQRLLDWTWVLSMSAGGTFRLLLGTLPSTAPGAWTEINTEINLGSSESITEFEQDPVADCPSRNRSRRKRTRTCVHVRTRKDPRTKATRAGTHAHAPNVRAHTHAWAKASAKKNEEENLELDSGCQWTCKNTDIFLTGCVPCSNEFGSDARSRKSEAKGA